MAKLKQFTVVGEAFELRGHHSPMTGINTYDVRMLNNSGALLYEDLVELVKAFHADLDDFEMLASEHYKDGDMISPYIRTMEDDWRNEEDEEEGEDGIHVSAVPEGGV